MTPTKQVEIHFTPIKLAPPTVNIAPNQNSLTPLDTVRVKDKEEKIKQDSPLKYFFEENTLTVITKPENEILRNEASYQDDLSDDANAMLQPVEEENHSLVNTFDRMTPEAELPLLMTPTKA